MFKVAVSTRSQARTYRKSEVHSDVFLKAIMSANSSASAVAKNEVMIILSGGTQGIPLGASGDSLGA